MLEIFLSIFLAYRNAQLAKRKGQNTVVWVIITLAAFFLTYLVAGAVYIAMLYNGPLDPKSLTEYMASHPFIMITLMFFGIGGYLIVRYILERMKDVQSSE